MTVMVRHCLALVVFCVALLAINALHFRFFAVNVVFYAAILDGMLATIISLLIAKYFIVKLPFFDIRNLQLMLIFLMAGYIYAISVPTVIDRSLSMYLLEKLDQQGGSLSVQAFKKPVLEEYMTEHRLSDVRLTEQLESGTVVIENGCVRLTPWGQKVAGFTRWYRQNLLPQQRLLMGQYSADLTDPFRNPSTLGEYRCGENKR